MYHFETGGNIYVYSTIDNKIYNYKENTVYDKEDSLNTQYTVCQDVYVYNRGNAAMQPALPLLLLLWQLQQSAHTQQPF